MVLARNLQGEATAYVAGESDIYTGLTQYVVCQQCCSGLSVRACDTYHLGVGVASGELDFRYYRYPFFRDFYHYGGSRGDAGAFYHLVGVEYEMLGVSALFERYVFLFKLRGVALGDISVVG